MTQPTSHENITPPDPEEVLDSAILFFVNDCLPDSASKDWAEAKRLEILSDISPDVLYGQNEDGTRGIDPDYAGGFLLMLRDAVRNAKTVEHKQSAIGTATKYLGTRRKPSDILSGKYGVDAQRAFLVGALMFVDVAIQAELFEREISEIQISDS